MKSSQQHCEPAQRKSSRPSPLITRHYRESLFEKVMKTAGAPSRLDGEWLRNKDIYLKRLELWVIYGTHVCICVCVIAKPRKFLPNLLEISPH